MFGFYQCPSCGKEVFSLGSPQILLCNECMKKRPETVARKVKKMREATIICGFSGIGKSTAEQKNRAIVDFESSACSHTYEKGFPTGRNALFPRNYIDSLCNLIDRDGATHYLISCHKEVREELKSRGLDYIIVLPTADQKNEYMKRWLKRGSSVDFIKSMDARWDDMIKSCEEDDVPKIYLSSGEYISDLICL